MKRSFVNILSSDVEKTSIFYEDLLGMKRHFNSDWFVILTHDDVKGLEFGVLQRDNPIVPISIRQSPAGVIVTFVVDDCDDIHRVALKLEADVIEPPTDMPYGQRRMLLRDPDGTVLDVSAPTAPVLQNPKE